MGTTATLEFDFGRTTYDLRTRTYVMGVLNVTPDSFSDGGRYYSPASAIRRALEMVDEGADFIDIGGESTRPGAEPVPEDEELRRVIPVVEQVAQRTSIPISIDTTKASVAERAVGAGAVVINDISGLHGDPSLAAIAAGSGATLVVMHMQGTPGTMQREPFYEDVVEDITSYLREGIAAAAKQGVEQIIIDPGIGFGKTVQHNLEILKRLGEFGRLGFPLLVGPSRKSFIGKILDLPVGERMEGTAAAVAVAIVHGANIVRVHDVKEMKRVARIVDEVVRC